MAAKATARVAVTMLALAPLNEIVVL